MKKQFSFFTAAILMIAVTFNISSCTKEEMSSPTGADENASANSSARFGNSKVFPSNASMYGSSYSEWSAAWWQYMMEFPNVTSHPFNDDPGFDASAGQTGDVWFLASPFGPVTRNINVPADKALFISMLNSEASDLEGLGATYTERLATANWQTDHAVVSSLSCTIDGVDVTDLTSYRVVSPEFTFNAPSPWIYGATGGLGTCVADGYFLMVKPLSQGTHTIYISGAFHFSTAEGDPFDFDGSLDLTYNITVQ